MPLKHFDTKDAIPEALRDGAVETKDGKFAVAIDDDTSGLRDSQRRLLDEKKKLEAQLNGLLNGRKPEDIAEILESHQRLEEERQKKAGEFDKLIEKRVRAKEEELMPRVLKGEEAIARLTKLEYEGRVRDLAESAGVDPKFMKAVFRTVQDDYLKMEEGDLVVLAPDGSKRSITAEEFFQKDFKKDYPEFYAGKAGSGGGATGGSGGTRQSAGGGAIRATDTAGFLGNLDNIASGKTAVIAE